MHAPVASEKAKSTEGKYRDVHWNLILLLPCAQPVLTFACDAAIRLHVHDGL
jgi:hypothetical protein